MRTLIWFGVCWIIDAINNDKFMKEIDSATFILAICIAFDVICYYRGKKRHDEIKELLTKIKHTKIIKENILTTLKQLKTNSFLIIEKLEDIKNL